MAMFDEEWFFGIQFSIFARLGTDDVVTPEDIPDILISDQIWSMIKETLESPGEGLEALRRFYGGSENLSNWDFMNIALWAAYFGDSEFAMEAFEKHVRINAVGLGLSWLPVMQDVRQTHRFKEFIREMGLVDYWNEFGWPNICRSLDDGDFECD